MTKTDIDVDTTNLLLFISRVKKNAADFRPVFRWATRQLQQAHSRNFQTHGAPVGGWKPLEANTFYDKRHSGYGNRGILVRTGELEDSLNGSRSSIGAFKSIDDISFHYMRFGTRVPYAKFHQTGTVRMHERQIVFVPKTFARETANKAADHCIMGGNPLSKSVAHSRNLFVQ